MAELIVVALLILLLCALFRVFIPATGVRNPRGRHFIPLYLL